MSIQLQSRGRIGLRRGFNGICIALFSLALLGCNSAGSEADLMASAKALLSKPDAKGAVIQLKNVLAKNPQSAEARFLLGKTLLEMGDPAAALVELRKAQELQSVDEQVIPELARGMLLVGEEAKVIAQYSELSLREPAAAADLKTTLSTAYAVKDDLDKARRSAAEALRLLPGYAPALIMQARLAVSDRDFDGALSFLDQVLGNEAGNERAGVLKGEILWQTKADASGALAAFDSVLAVHPASIPALTAKLNNLFQQKKLDVAKVEFEKLKQSAPDHPETLFFEAQFAFANRDYKKVRELADRILKFMPDNTRVLELAGASEFHMQNFLQAEVLLGRALKNSPRQLMTRQLLAQTYMRTAQPDKAVEVLMPVIETPKADGASLTLAGEAYLQLGDSRRSDDAFKRALKMSPGDPRIRTSAAVAQLSKGNADAALIELESIAGSSSGARADLALINGRLRKNDLVGALKAIDALEKKMPEQPLPHHLRGRVLLAQEDNAGAAKNFQVALAKNPAYFPSLASLAGMDFAADKPELARRRLADFLKANPKSYQALLAMAELESRTGASAAAVTATIKNAIQLNPSEPSPHLLLINRLLGLGDGKAALVVAQDATAALPNNLEVMDALGRAQMAAGDGQRAVSTFKKLASQQPKNARHELRLADAHMLNKDHEQAARAWKQALVLQPDNNAARRGQALLALINKRPQEAVTIAQEMQQRSPKDSAGFALEAEIEAGRKNWTAAASAYKAVLQRSRSPEAAVRLHVTLNAGGKSTEADRMAADWLKENPKDSTFRYYLGDLALGQNDLGRAEGHYRGVLEVQPANAMAMNNVAWLLVKQQKPGALIAAEKANALLPDSAPLLDTLSMALEAENQIPKAIEAQKRAIALEPNDPMLPLRLAKLFVKLGDKPRARAELEPLVKLGDKFNAQAEVTTMLKAL